MRMSQLFGERVKENPADAVWVSHQFLVRGGYVRQREDGGNALLPPGRLLLANLERLLRERLASEGAQEIGLPLLRRPTGSSQHEASPDPIHAGLQAMAQLVRSELSTYARYPGRLFSLRQEVLPPTRVRGGLLGAREGTLLQGLWMDLTAEAGAHAQQSLLNALVVSCIRAGLSGILVAESEADSPDAFGAMGIFMPHPMGDAQLAVCPGCGYQASLPVAGTRHHQEPGTEIPLARVHTPDIRDIASLSAVLVQPENRLMKATVFAVSGSERPLIVFLRGDLQVSQAKVSRLVGAEVTAWPAEWDSGLSLGFVGAIGLPDSVDVLYDDSLQGLRALACGANETDWHLAGLSMPRDLPHATFHEMAMAREGSLCPGCGVPMETKPVVTLGRISQYNTGLAEREGVSFTDPEGQRKTPHACGCWLAVDRMAACVVEACHDKFGPVWPPVVAPWQVQICLLNGDQEPVRSVAETLYQSLGQAFSVLYDDRGQTAGSQFAEADLLGAPVRVIVSRRNLDNGEVEVASRDKAFRQGVPMAAVASVVREALLAR